MAAFAMAMIMQVATNLLHVREGLQQRAGGIARAAGVGTIEALRLGDKAAAANALSALRDERMVSIAEVFLPGGKKIASYDRAANDVSLEPAAQSTPRKSAGQFEIIVPATRAGAELGYV